MAPKPMPSPAPPAARALLRGGAVFACLGAGIPEETRAQEILSDLPPPVVAARIPSGETGQESDHMTGDWGGRRTRWIENGFHFSTGYTGEGFANVHGGRQTGTAVEGLWEFGLDVNPAGFSGWEGSAARLAVLYPHGISPSAALVGDLSGVSNIDADDSLRLFELWVEQGLWEDKVNLRLGQMGADEEFFTSDLGALFLNATFGWSTYRALNTPTPAYPQGAIGARLRLRPVDAFWLQTAVYDGDPDPAGSDGEPTNPHGVRINMNAGEGFLWITEAVLTRHDPADAERHLSLIKLGAWYHSGEFQHLSEDENGLTLGAPGSSGMAESLHGNFGIYGILDQWLWSETHGEEASPQREGLGGFLRVGWSPPDRNPVHHYADGGFTYRGLVPGRGEDAAGLGLAVVHLSGELRDLARQAGEVPPDYELIIEATYEMKVRPWWLVQPDVQYIIHPGGSEELPNAVVVGLRTSFIF